MWEQKVKASHVGSGWLVQFENLPRMKLEIQQPSGPLRVVHAQQSPAGLAALAFCRKKYPT